MFPENKCFFNVFISDVPLPSLGLALILAVPLLCVPSQSLCYFSLTKFNYLSKVSLKTWNNGNL